MANLLTVVLRITGQNAASGAITGLNQGLELAQAGVQALNDTVGEFIRQGIQMNAMLETSTLQFTTLMGSADKAQERVRGLAQFAAKTPFRFEDALVGARNLETFGGSALDTDANLRLVGDAAAATGNNLQDVSFWFGRAYGAIQAGRPFGEAAQRLQEMGVLTGEQRNKMEALQATHAKASDVLAALTGGFERFDGAMEKQARTMDGLVSTFQDDMALLAAPTTERSFRAIEAALAGVNAQLESPESQEGAKQTNELLGFMTEQGLNLGGTLLALGVTLADTSPQANAARAWLLLHDQLVGTAEAAAGESEAAASNAHFHGLAAQNALDAAEAHKTLAERLADVELELGKEAAGWRDVGEAIQAANLQPLADFMAHEHDAKAMAEAQAELAANTAKVNEQLAEEGQRLAELAGAAGDQFTRHPPPPPTTEADVEQAAAEMQRKQDEADRKAQQAQQTAAREAEQIAREHWQHLNDIEDRGLADRRRLEDRDRAAAQQAQMGAVKAEEQSTKDAFNAQIRARTDRRDAALGALDAEVQAAHDAHDARLAQIYAEGAAAEAAHDAERRALENQARAAERAHDRTLRRIEEEASARELAIQQQLYDLDAVDRREQRAAEDAQHARDLQEARQAVAAAEADPTHAKLGEARQRLRDVQARAEQDRRDRARQDRRDALRDELDETRATADVTKQAADDIFKAKKDSIDARARAADDRSKAQKDAGDAAKRQADADLKLRLDDLEKQKKAEKDAADAHIQQMKDAQAAAETAFKAREEAMQRAFDAEKERVDDLRRAYDQLAADARYAAEHPDDPQAGAFRPRATGTTGDADAEGATTTTAGARGGVTINQTFTIQDPDILAAVRRAADEGTRQALAAAGAG
jgi:hypothetical protein